MAEKSKSKKLSSNETLLGSNVDAELAGIKTQR